MLALQQVALQLYGISSMDWIKLLSECQKMARPWCGSWINDQSLWWQSGATFAVESCLSFQVSRSCELDVSREQTADCNVRGHLRNLCCHLPLWIMLPFPLEPFMTVFFFLFLRLHFTLAFILSSAVCSWPCTSRKLPPWTSDLYPYKSPACSQIYFHPLFSISVLHAPLFSPAFLMQKLQLLWKFQ